MRLAGLAFATTCVCVFAVNLPRWDAPGALSLPSLWASCRFTAILMGVLLAHELGHLLAARFVGIRTGPPWFVPFPFVVGTMGAIIVPEETPRDRTRLALMAASGPLVGAVCVVALLLATGAWQDPGGLAAAPRLASPPVWAAVQWMTDSPPGVASNDPVGLALWIACAVTWINLMPFGQLDGGHLWSTMFPEHATAASWATTATLLLLAFWWPYWLVWAVMLHVLGSRHPSDLRRPDICPSSGAMLAAAASLAVFVLFAVPCPWS